MKKYKLVKSFPGSPNIGAIFVAPSEDSTHYVNGRTSYCLKLSEVESNSEFFAPYLFTTEDGVEIYRGDNYWLIWLHETDKCEYHEHMVPIFIEKGYTLNEEFTPARNVVFFSTREAAQEYLDSLKLKFKKGEWLICNDNYEQTWKLLFRYSSIEDADVKGYECYTVWNHGRVDIDSEESNVCQIKDCKKATSEQIQEVLSKVAIHKGFKEGVKFRSAILNAPYKVSKYVEFKYQENRDALFEGWGNCVYYQGKWAEIVKDEIHEYVECVSKYPPIGATTGKIYKSFYKPGSSHPYRWYTEDSCSGENGYSTLEMFMQVFKPSTKQAYDLQQISDKMAKQADKLIVETLEKEQEKFKLNSKQVTVTVEGEVTSVSSWGNSVKINYQ